MAGIDDWYLDYAHRHELTPGYSVDDDVPDPFAFGEAPSPEWVVPQLRTPKRPGRDGSPKANPGQLAKANRAQSQAKNTAQKPPVAARRQASVRLGRGRRVAGWRQFALRWLRTNPDGSNRELKAAVEEAGFLPIVKAEIAEIRAELAAAKKAPRRKPLPRARRTAPPPPAAVHVTPVRYCDSCGLAVTNDGRCRC